MDFKTFDSILIEQSLNKMKFKAGILLAVVK